MLELRLLTPADAAAFRDIRLRALQEEPTAFTSSTEEFSHQTLDKIAARFRSDLVESFMLGAFQDRKLVGLVGFYRETALKQRHKGSIISLYVAPEARGQGLGRALMRDAIRRVRDIEGVERLLLGVMVTQTAARQLYESLDFVVYGREARALCIDGQYYDEEFMTLDLREDRP
ncbi:phosphinothricin acetyltransferase [Gammaproteobacteria bacterium]|nr:phosphinothricin acetyltransferase [Gammaproteobacteria bacterium]